MTEFDFVKMNRLLKKSGNKNIPLYVPIKVESYSTINNCFYNVIDKVNFNNGKIIYGWKLHQTRLMVEAERHAVWKSPNGELVDITPDVECQDKTLFLEEDNGWTYKEQYSDNIRINITDNPLVDDFILLCETITKLWQTGKRKSKSEIEILEPVANLIHLLERNKIDIELFILSKNNKESNCYCGSLIKYKNCHGKDLKCLYDVLINKVNEIIEKSMTVLK